jgi:hypothetical protein
MNNLPPGVNESGIPGNTIEDGGWDQLYEWLLDSGLEPEEIKRLVVNGQKLLKWATSEDDLSGATEYHNGFCDGYDAAAGWVKIIMESP